METTTIEIVGPAGTKYQVGKKIAESEKYSLYVCSIEEKEGVFILKIATEKKYNGDLDREALLLTDLFKEAQLTQEEFEKRTEKKGTSLNYHFYFPGLIESFISDAEQVSGRRISILDFSHIRKERGELTPLSRIIEDQKLRVDPRTSAWIMGKLLKAIDFVHSQNILIEDLSVDNILINPKEHYISIQDWDDAKISPIPLTEEETGKEISQAAQSIVALLGGNETDWSIPDDPQLKDGQYQEMLQKLCRGEISDAKKAHKDFYSLIRSIWPREFHHYTTYNL